MRPEVRPIGWGHAWLGVATWIALHNKSGCQALSECIEGGPWRHILEGLPDRRIGETRRIGDNLRKLSPASSPVRSEIRAIQRSYAWFPWAPTWIAAHDLMEHKALYPQPEGAAFGHVLKGLTGNSIIEACCLGHYFG